jgi:hypothetical protein
MVLGRPVVQKDPGEELVLLSVKVPAKVKKKLIKHAAAQNKTTGQFVREILDYWYRG